VKFLPLVFRNLGRNKLRSLLTGGAIALAIALVCFLRTMPAGLDAFLNDLASNTRISIHNEAGMVYAMPYAYLQKVRALPGVVAATSWSWFGGAFEPDKGVTFPNFSVDPDAVAEVYADYNIDPVHLEAFRQRRDGALAGAEIMERYRWQVGDEITLRGTVFPIDLTFHIVGVIPGLRSGLFWFRRDYFEQAMLAQGAASDQIGMIWARIDDPDRVEPVMREITAMFRNSEAEVAVETEKGFFGSMFGSLRGFVTVILVVTGLVTLCIVFIAANTASMSVRERVRELAILRAIGYRRQLIFGTLLAEATLLAGVAGTLGAFASLGLTLFVREYAGGWAPGMGPLTRFVVTNAILVQSIFLAFFIGILSGYVPSWGASRKSVTATLREVF
jgi:putative ABC transport system permease protein